MNEQNLQLLKVTGIKDQEYIVALVEGGGDISSLGKIVEGPFEGWAFTYPKNASWHLWLEIEHLRRITEWVSNLNKYGSPEMFSEDDTKPDPPMRFSHPDMETPKPHWARWVAMDNDGNWYWHSNRPVWNGQVDEWVFTEEEDSTCSFAGYTPHPDFYGEYELYYVGGPFTGIKGEEDNE